MGEAMPESVEAAENKTASLFRAAAEVGALRAGAADAQVEAARRYGRMLGLAYQLRDDQLDGENIADPAPYAESAERALDGLPLGEPRELLRALARYAAERTC